MKTTRLAQAIELQQQATPSILSNLVGGKAAVRSAARTAVGIRTERSPHKVLARGGSLMGNVDDPTMLWAWTVRHVERLIEELHFHVVRTDAMGVHVAWKDGESTGGLCKLPCSSDRFDELLDAARVALRRA